MELPDVLTALACERRAGRRIRNGNPRRIGGSKPSASVSSRFGTAAGSRQRSSRRGVWLRPGRRRRPRRARSEARPSRQGRARSRRCPAGACPIASKAAGVMPMRTMGLILRWSGEWPEVLMALAACKRRQDFSRPFGARFTDLAALARRSLSGRLVAGRQMNRPKATTTTPPPRPRQRREQKHAPAKSGRRGRRGSREGRRDRRTAHRLRPP